MLHSLLLAVQNINQRMDGFEKGLQELRDQPPASRRPILVSRPSEVSTQSFSSVTSTVSSSSAVRSAVPSALQLASTSSTSVASVNFSDPPVQQLPLDLVPEGWRILKDGMTLGTEPGTIIFPDGTPYGPLTIDLDVDAYERPIWRFKKRPGTPRTPKGKIPVRQAFEDLLAALEMDPAAAMEWNRSAFHPPGSTSERALLVHFDDGSLISEFLSKSHSWFSALVKKDKISWDEAASPCNIVPESLSAISADSFVNIFQRKEFPTNEPARIFNSESFPQFPKAAVQEEFGARQNLLACLNTTMIAESLARQSSPEDPSTASKYALLKSSLQPLWTAFVLFSKKKLDLRKKALKNCWPDNVLVLKLLMSNPFSEDLFSKEAMEDITMQAERQAKSLLSILGFKGYKRAAPQQQVRPQKRQRGASSQRSAGQRTPSRYRSDSVSRDRSGEQDSQQSRNKQNSSPGRRYPGTPKRSYHRSPKGRGGKSPVTPRRGQMQEKNF